MRSSWLSHGWRPCCAGPARRDWARYPWIDEVISLATKYPNFHIDTSAYTVNRLPSALVEYMRGHGRSRVLFGTNWPMLSGARCLEHLDDLGLDDEARGLFLSGKARRVFNLPEG